MWFADTDVYKTLEAAAWELGRSGRADRRVPGRRGGVAGEGAGRGRLPGLLLPGRPPRRAVVRPGLQPRDVLRRPPHPGGRRRGAGRRGRARVPAGGRRSPAASRTCSYAGTARAARTRSTGIRRSRPRSSSCTGSPATGRTSTLASALRRPARARPARRAAGSGRATCRTTSRSATPTRSPGTPCGSSTCWPARSTWRWRRTTPSCWPPPNGCGTRRSPARPTSPAGRVRGTATRRSATRTSCRRTAPTPRRARPSAASSGRGGCCWPPAGPRYADEMERLLYNGIAGSTAAGRHARSSTPTRCNCAPGTTARTRTPRRSGSPGTPARAARRTWPG